MLKIYLVKEELMNAVTHFIGSKHMYTEAKPIIDALLSSQTAMAEEKPADEIEPVIEEEL
jgi:hypothetical protein